MLGVLKRRWKPKRSSNGSRISSGCDTSSLDGDKPQLRSHQVHPVLDSHHIVGYEKHPLEAADCPSTPPPPPRCLPLAPNICVEAGRIQFVRSETGGVTQHNHAGVSPPPPPTIDGIASSGRVTVTRGLQTEGDDEFGQVQSFLETRIVELEMALEAAQKSELRDKQTINKLTKQLNRRESAQRDADRERRLRVDSETRAKQALQEAARCRSRLKLLTTEFARMEETVRAMLVYKKQAEQLRQEKAALTLAFENRCQQYQSTIARLNLEIATLRQQLEEAGRDNNPEGILQAHTAALQRHAEESRKQYEKCLDDVANQVVKALLAQKGLREEVGCLNNKIQELESQNRALTSMLVHQLRGDTAVDLDTFTGPMALENGDNIPDGQTEIQQSLLSTSLTTKHCNSFNSDILEDSPNSDKCDKAVVSSIDKRLSADSVSVLDTRLSLEDKKRHQILTKLWTDLKGTEVTPKKLLEALTAVDSALWVPPKRPVSLNLQLPILQTTRCRRTRPVLAQSSSKSEEETTGNESPESGNRDEGYSTMSSDVQADVTRGSGDATLPHRSLEDLKEASDETDISDTRLLVTDNKDPDILYIPLNLLNLKQRNSFPPGKDIFPFQHIMRSFSDSHLCIKITTAPTPCYTFTSPISSSPSIFLLDITEKSVNPLRRTRATNALWGNSNVELTDDKSSPISWSSAVEDRLGCANWDAEYIQHWLRLDETRTALQQQHRDLFELEYDRAELEDWSLSLSNDDLREYWKKMDAATPGQISISTLPSIQENNTLELEEDSNECLWNNSSYMMDKEGRELITFLMDGCNGEKQWPYAASSAVHQQISPDNSWSSGGSDCCNSHEPETCSKRSSAASDDTGELPQIGTDFTRDFYRLVKFESTKSLASTSSRSIGGALSENGDRDATLQNVLTFIAEQQKYVHCRDRPKSANDFTKEFNIECPSQHFDEIRIPDYNIQKEEPTSKDNENYVTLRQLCREYEEKEKGKENGKIENKEDFISDKISYAEEVCLVTPLDVESENCSNIGERAVDICASVNVELISTGYQCEEVQDRDPIDDTSAGATKVAENLVQNDGDLIKSTDTSYSDASTHNCTSESLTSSVSTPETVTSKIPRRKTSSRIPVSPARMIVNNNNNKENSQDTKIPKSKLSYRGNKLKPKKIVQVQQNVSAQHFITSEKLPEPTSGVLSNIIEGPPHRAVSFHERATSKDVIEELNRIIKSGDETVPESSEAAVVPKLDQACRPTGWIHVEKDIDLTDPKARANLLDVMMASVSSDSSPTSSCGGSVASDSTEDPPDYGHLHRIHKYHRQKKAKAVRPDLAATSVAVVRATVPSVRPTIIGRPDFFVRYGEKEREAVASFDFLNEFSSENSSLSCSVEDNIEEVVEVEPTPRVVRVSQV
ncbi:uncharacterized protein LOC132703328 isoform X2 [Cylas formicarius]|uniref:uncharacterized protein LOC132703328 isoform X2 n=1 Tax=Cylas formicarius TaxID=197179 RepID=UPI0029584E7D|nr:uncharacterized protein LOC132703328 isoform X2 [Cylas formicarius]